MLYSSQSQNANAEAFSVRLLSRSDKTKEERAAIGARILDERLAICDLTVHQVAMLCGTNPSAINKRRIHPRAAHRRPGLAEHLQRATPAERLEAARAIGIDVIWDEMISPAIGADG